MSISSTTSRVDYTGNGAVDTYDYTFLIFEDSDLLVTVRDTEDVETTLTLTTHYTVTGAGAADGGTVVLVNGAFDWLDADGDLDSGYIITIRRVRPLTQTTDIRNQGQFFAATHEDAFDHQVMLAQQQQDELDRSAKMPETSQGVDVTLPLPVAGQAIGWNDDEDGFINLANAGDLSVSNYIESLLDDADAATARATLGFSGSGGTVAPGNIEAAAVTYAKLASATIDAITIFGLPKNLSLAFSVASNALTINVKTRANATASSTDPIIVPMRSSTLTNGTYEIRTITAALSLVISSGSTLGHNNALPALIYYYLIDNAGTLELAASSKFFGMSGIVSTTAEGGAGAADSGTAIYSTTARSSVSYTCIGYSIDTQTTAGTWAAVPTQATLAPFSQPVISFSAHKNASNQSIANDTITKLTFGTEIYDNFSLFASDKWTPPPGNVRLYAQMSMIATTDQELIHCFIYKNGAEFKASSQNSSGTTTLCTSVCIEDECNGTDYYEVYGYQNSGGASDVNGSASRTFFMGSWTPGRS